MSDTVTKEATKAVADTTPATETTPANPAAAATKKQIKAQQKLKKVKRPPMKKGLKWLIWLVALGLIGGLSIWGVRSLSDKFQSGQDGGPKTGMVMAGRLESFVSGWGSVESKRREELGKKTKGTVTEVLVASGDVVKNGDPLFKIDPKEVQKELDTALTTLDDAQNTLTNANKDITNLNIKAPFNGKIIKKEDIKKEQSLAKGATIATFVNDSTMKLSLYFSYAYINDVAVGQSATISVPDSMSTVNGKVTAIEKVKKISTDGSVQFKVVLEMTNPGSLTAEMLATASIKTPNGEAVPAESGKLEYSQTEEIKAKATGDVLSVNMQDFMEYKAGTTLISLSGEASQTALRAAQRAHETAAKNVEELQKLVGESTIVSPMDGMVTAVVISPGDVLTGAGTALITVSDLSSLIVSINIDELDISKVSLNMPVTVTVEQSDKSDSIVGTLTEISFEAKSSQNGGGGGGGGGAASFPAKILIDNVGSLLMPGMGVSYKISSNLRENCLMVPNSAVVFAENTAAVYAKPLEGEKFETILPTPEGTEVPAGFVLVPVQIGIADDQNTEIISGLTENTEVFLASAATNPYGDMGGMMGGGSVMVG